MGDNVKPQPFELRLIFIVIGKVDRLQVVVVVVVVAGVMVVLFVQSARLSGVSVY